MKNILIVVLTLVVIGMGLFIFNSQNTSVVDQNEEAESDNVAVNGGEDKDKQPTQPSLITYTDPVTGVSLNYPQGWSIETNEFGFRLSKSASNNTELMFSVGKIGQFSYDPSHSEKTTFMGKEAYIKTFTGCSSEGGDSGTACYLKILQVVMGEKKETSLPLGNINIVTKGIDITYGVSEKTTSQYGNTQTVYEQNTSALQSILSSLQFN